MANIKSKIKRIHTNEVARLRNQSLKSSLRTAVRSFREAAESGDKEKAAELLVSAAEWAELTGPAPELRGFLGRHIQMPGLKWRQVRFEATS